MPEKIQPALTPFQWSTIRSENAVVSVVPTPGLPTDPVWRVQVSANLASQYLAVANHALADEDPRKLTHERIRRMRETARRLIERASADTLEHGEAQSTLWLADALESYLPPVFVDQTPPEDRVKFVPKN
jgi:hypothetical protein